MAQIHILDSETIDKIAAGEVVERPASVVKELVENAIDAGADAVTVEIRDGGIEFIRVTDNGCGMEGDQLRTAFLRHATSKIEDASDLTRISSLGFRGEALSSIAAVARVEVVSKTAGSILGSRILLEGAKEVGFEEVGAPEGTTFLVRNLFFNTPARRKFLKQPATEGGYIVELMQHLALSRPDVSFKLEAGGQMKFHTSGSGDLKEVIYRIYGRDAAAELVPIQAERDGMRAEGYLGKPVQVRSSRSFEICFLNGRFIRSNVVSKAVEEGYREYLMQHKFPFCVLHIAMDAGDVDVNVHPTKMDVRFSDSLGFSSFLMESVRGALREREMIPDVLLATERELRDARKEERRGRERLHAPEPFEERRGEAYRVMEETAYAAQRPEAQEFTRNPVWERVKGGAQEEEEKDFSGRKPVSEQGQADLRAEDLQDSSGRKPAEGKTAGKGGAEEAEEEPFFTETSELPEDAEPPVGLPLTDVPPAGLRPPPSGEPPFAPSYTGEQRSLFEEKLLTPENRRRFRVIGQVFETYWLVEFEDRMMMIDQHAAHEKVNYERLMRQYREKSVLSQGLLPPVVVSLTGQEEALLREHLDVFTGLGFEIEPFGGSEYALRSVPADLYGCGEREMFLEVLDAVLDGTGFGTIRAIEERIASMSCKAAVKGNSRLSAAEAEALIDELLTLDNPYSCPHGRPTIVAMTKAEMDRKFKRIVG